MGDMKQGKSHPIESVATITLLIILFSHYLAMERMIYLAMVLLLLGLASKKVAKVIAMLWNYLVSFIGKVSSTVILVAIYYLVMTPIALIYRLFHGNNLSSNLGSVSADGYWLKLDRVYNERDLKRPF